MKPKMDFYEWAMLGEVLLERTSPKSSFTTRLSPCALDDRKAIR